MRNEAILALIAEMKAKLNHPEAGELTIELATITLQEVMPLIADWRASKARTAAVLTHPNIPAPLAAWAAEALQSL